MLTYPTADVDRLLNRVFEEADRRLDDAPSVDVEFWLFGLARSILVNRDDATSWMASNCLRIIDLLEDTATHLQDWHLWEDLNLIIEVLRDMTAPDQEILRIVTCLDNGVTAEQLALAIAVTPAAAETLLQTVLGALRARFERGIDAPTGDEP